MKLPSIFKTSTHQRFSISPRYYDPIKEEIAERTARIKRELEGEGLLHQKEGESTEQWRTAFKGSFSSYRGIKMRNTSVFNSTAMIRTLLFLGMVISAFGYIYIGPQIFTYLSMIGIGGAGIYFLLKLMKKGKDA
ncbi:MAG: hypothetical protein O2829_01185 [Bacteroidetes bacterium]|nr:hypothetical protein [Bacteroidota bacterium]MDA1267694.1 hypothetical protein [Bacteroidota bacterium]